MRFPRLNFKRGVTLVETTVSIGIMSILFSTSATTFIVGARALETIHVQSRNQVQCTMAMERVVNLLRNATTYQPVTGDDPASGKLKRIRFAIPIDRNVYDLAWGTLSFTPSAQKSSAGGESRPVSGKVTLTWDKEVEFKDGVGVWNNEDMDLKGITDFAVRFESDQRVMLSMAFYQPGIKGRATDRLEDNVYETQVTAKNHILLEGLGLGGENETLALQF